MREIQKKERTVEYWDCGRDDCSAHHKTKDAAVKCREKAARDISARLRYKRQTEKYIMCATRKANGETYAAIARELGSSPTYIRYMAIKGNKILTKRARLQETT